MLVTVVSAVNNGDTTYTITFSEAIVNLSPGTPTPDPNFLLFSATANGWQPAIFSAAEIGNTITITMTGLYTDATNLAILAQPSDLSAADPFQIIAPIVAVI